MCQSSRVIEFDALEMIRWDAHTCLALHPDASFEPIERLRRLGVSYVSINVGMDMNPVSQIMSVIAGFRSTIDRNPDTFRLATSVADVTEAKAGDYIAIGFDLEGSMPLLDRPEMVELYASLGVRQIHFAYNRNNSVAGGCHDEPQGLTLLGRRMVAAVNATGMLMDCSHTERRTTLDIMSASSKPVIFSHSNPLSLVEHGRNITDEQIRACAATNGVVCVSGIDVFVGAKNVTATDVARHARYVAELVGPEHVGFGLDDSFAEEHLDDTPPDFDPHRWWPASAGYADDALSSIGCCPIDEWSALPSALAAEGFTPAEIEMALGANMLRVAKEVWPS
jgi:membrane dipeptidase